MADFRLVDGVQCSELGIALESGVRCAHGVVDGDKPLAQSGPSCTECRAAWYPHMRSSKVRGELRETVHCFECGEKLHLTYGQVIDTVRSEDGRTTGYRERYAPISWSHGAPRGCARTVLPVVGHEDNYRGHGWGRWEQHASEILRSFHNDLERTARLRESVRRQG